MIHLRNHVNTGSSTAFKPVTAGKGLKGLNCNRTACQKPDSAHHYNRITNAYYCLECAIKIEKVARNDGESFFSDLPKGAI